MVCMDTVNLLSICLWWGSMLAWAQIWCVNTRPLGRRQSGRLEAHLPRCGAPDEGTVLPQGCHKGKFRCRFIHDRARIVVIPLRKKAIPFQLPLRPVNTAAVQPQDHSLSE